MVDQKIRKKRRERGYSQSHMADKLGITTSAYGKIERGEVRIDIDRLKQISEVLEVDVAELWNDDKIVVTHHGDSNDCSMGSNGVIIRPSYNVDVENYQRMFDHMKEEIFVLRKDNERLLRLVEKLSDK